MPTHEDSEDFSPEERSFVDASARNHPRQDSRFLRSRFAYQDHPIPDRHRPMLKDSLEAETRGPKQHDDAKDAPDIQSALDVLCHFSRLIPWTRFPNI